jgi:hypothetical protein
MGRKRKKENTLRQYFYSFSTNVIKRTPHAVRNTEKDINAVYYVLILYY